QNLALAMENDKTVIWVRNKVDLPSSPAPGSPGNLSLEGEESSILKISAATGLGVSELQKKLVESAQLTVSNQTVVTNMRHYEHLVKTSAALEEVLTGLDSGITGDFLAQDIRLALHHLGEITGQIVTDDL